MHKYLVDKKMHSLTHNVLPFQKSCRPIKCPIWKIFFRGECRFYSHRWIGGPFVITLMLKPDTSKYKIPKAYFENMPRRNRNDRMAKWLKRKTMKQWKISTFYHTSDDGDSVEYLIIEAKLQFSSVNPKHIEETVKAAFDDTWYILNENKKITLKLYFSEGRSYIVYLVDFGTRAVSTAQNYTYSYTLFREGDNDSNENEDDPLFYVSDRVYVPPVGDQILLTKLYFCHQVDLLPDEYEDDNNKRIFFTVKNVTLYDFRRVNSITSGDVVKQTVRVCLSEFETAPSVGGSNQLVDSNMQMLFTFIVLFPEHVFVSVKLS